jgi:glycosyltransferase involved in cell wall biosynthesis
MTMNDAALLVLHDYFEAAEGGGRLCLILAKALGADLGYGFRLPRHPFFEQPFPGREHDLGLRTDLPLWRQLRLARGFARDTGFARGYRAVVYSGFYAPLAVANRPDHGNLYYCHTPPRFLYDQRDFYLDRLPLWQRPLLMTFCHYLRQRYEQALERMQVIVANSETVRGRLKHYLGRDCFVVNPPCDTAAFNWRGQDGYYLSMARLDPLKRVDLVVRAFREMLDRRLIVASGGPELENIRRLAAGAANIRILGWVSEAQLGELLGRAIATVYVPRDEDFGMSPVESMAAGKPVIGVAEGGVRETVLPGETGILVRSNPDVADITAAVEELTPDRALAMRKACEARARDFDTAVFLRGMRAVLELA